MSAAGLHLTLSSLLGDSVQSIPPGLWQELTRMLPTPLDITGHAISAIERLAKHKRLLRIITLHPYFRAISLSVDLLQKMEKVSELLHNGSYDQLQRMLFHMLRSESIASPIIPNPEDFLKSIGLFCKQKIVSTDRQTTGLFTSANDIEGLDKPTQVYF
ncbi:hypothetical protein LTR86_008179 [Recurvomyces mirabilis]|nr:hypothetical protein LTR86_008179 [Recurvomyces mirabilis]